MQKKQEKVGLIWFTTNLRTKDLSSLTKAQSICNDLIAVYFIDPIHFKETPYGFKRQSVFRVQFLLETLKDLKLQLKELGISFLILKGSPRDYLPNLMKQYQISDLFAQKEFTSEETSTYSDCIAASPSEVQWHFQYDQFLIAPQQSPFNSIHEVPFQFTAFRKKIESKPNQITLEPKPYKINSKFQVHTELPSLKELGYDAIETDHRSAFQYKGGSAQALLRLEEYFWKTNKVSFYKKTRNQLIGSSYSTKFSPYLALGAISAKTIVNELHNYESTIVKNESTYWVFFELLWRDFFKYTALKYTDNFFKIGGLKNSSYTYYHDFDKVTSWIQGATNDDFVNANMLELKHTGWMSNRGRQNVASYFVHQLQQDWRIGAAYFESLLLDYDVHSNYGNWMYLAGVGNDPRSRMFNTQLQAERYDPSKSFQKLWLQTSLSLWN